MALIYPTIWEQGGQPESLSPGYHYKKHVQSLAVPDHQVVTIYENEDRQGKKSMPLYGGTYHHLYFYSISDRPGLIHVKDCGLTELDLVEIGWWSQYGKEADERYPMYYSLPTGDHKGDEGFPDNRIQWLYIPFGMTVEVFNSDNFQGGSLIFSGNTQGEKERVNLWDHKFSDGGNSASWRTSSMKVRADKWEPAGIELRDVSVQSDDHSKFGGTTSLYNNSPHKGMVGKEISWEKGQATEENWNIGGRVCAKAGFEAETSIMGQSVKVTGELEVEVSGGYGEVASKNSSKTITDTVGAELEGWGNAKVSTIIEYGKMTAKAIRKWRNTRNNVIIEEEGEISFSWANDAQHEINGTRTAPIERQED